MQNLIGKLFAPLLLLSLFANPALSELGNKRPKIGLVLKGGGALGCAHVGVIRVLEQNRIPVDFIAGTSMGSIVGAAYASGATVDEMQNTLVDTDWGALFGEKIERQNIDYRLRAGRNRELFGDVKLGMHNGEIVIPRGVVEGQNIRLLFQKLFRNATSPISFDALPIPFRAVTADVESGEAYVPSRGDLPMVVRASMSIPGAFSPVEIDGRLLVDGGIVNNLPVDIARSMGADILIVVDLFSPLAKRDDLASPISISGQMVSLLLMQNSTASRRTVSARDVVVEPDVTGFAVTDFPKAKELIAIGESAALSVLPLLRKLSVSQEAFDRYSTNRTKPISYPKSVDFVRIKNKSNVSDERIRELLSIKDGDSYDPKSIEDGIGRIYQSGQFTTVKYSRIEEGGLSGIEVNADGKDYLNEFVRLGFSLEDNFEGDNNFRLGGAFRTYDIGTRDGYLEAQVEIGKMPRASLELFQPIANESPYFIAPKLSIGRTRLNVSNGTELIGEYSRTEGLANATFGRRLGNLGEATIDYTRGFGDLSRRIGSPSLNDINYDIGDVSAGIDLDTMDKPDFATTGFRLSTRVNAAVDALGAPNDYQEITGLAAYPITFGRNTLLLRNSFVSTFGDRPLERSSSLGGFANISGVLQSSITASNYNSGMVALFHRFSEVQNPFFDLAFFGGATYELSTISNADPRIRDYSLINSGSIFLGADTPLFPIYFGFGMASLGEHSFYISFGRIGTSSR
jgi:NTE family protein